MTHLSRRLFLGGFTALAVHPTFARSAALPASAAGENPLVLQRADAQIFRLSSRSWFSAWLWTPPATIPFTNLVWIRIP
jgi:hypothetical protein